MVFQNDILAGASGTAAGYTIDQSIRFNDDDSAYLSRTTSGAGNRKTFTISLWFKRGKIPLSGGSRALISAWTGSASDSGRAILGVYTDQLFFSGYATNWRWTNAVFRDASAWYHVVIAVDTTQATAGDRIKMYINGELQTSFLYSGNPSLNADLAFNDTASDYYIAYEAPAVGGAGLYDGYESEIYLIDGQALAPTDFGETNDDGVWIPKAYTGTYGTNGFYITGEDSADLGADYSGNGNDFTSSGLTSDDQVTDTPTDNYATWNPLRIGANIILSDGNLKAVTNATVAQTATGTFGLSSGKWYWEVTNQGGSIGYTGIVDETHDMGTYIGSSSTGSGYAYNTQGEKVGPTSGTTAAYGATYTTGDVIGVALDMDAGTLAFYKNGASQGTAFSGLTGTWFPAVSGNGVAGKGGVADFGQSGFAYTPPTGFKALSTANLPTPAIKDGSAYFQTTLYTGNGTAIGSGGNAVSQSENSTFQPDFVWIKRRDSAVEHVLTDAVRGVTEELSSNDTGAEETVAEGLTTFGSSGFTVGSDGSYNTNTGTYAAWQWLAGNGTASNTDGTITSTVSANTTAGFSISTYTGTGSNATVGHGLGSAPSMVIVKNRTTAGYSWKVYHKEAGATYHRQLDSTAAFTTVGGSTIWNNTAPTSSVFSVGTSTQVNGSANNYVAYAFAEVEGFSKFGAYTGNGSADGPFVYCGFRPAFVITRRFNSTGNWTIFDNQREGYNVDNDELVANTTAAETTTDYVDILSNGFKLRSSDADVNASGNTYIFMAFAEHPFGGDGAAPVPAR